MKKLFRDRFVNNLVFCTIITFIIEIIFKVLSEFEIFSWSTLRILLSTFILSFIVTFISSLTNKRWIKNIINLIYIFVYALYALLQVGFINYLGVYISFNTSSQFGAVTDYIGDFLASLKLEYFTVFIPFIIALLAYILLFRKNKFEKFRFNITLIITFILFVGAIFGYYKSLTIPFMQNKLQIKSNAKLFQNPDVPTVAANQFGVLGFGILDLKSYLFPVNEEQITIDYDEKESPLPTGRVVSPFLDELAQENNSKYGNITKFLASQDITNTNDYTGMFKDKNVIVILIESANEFIANEEYFPNFYKMYSEGWHWVNNYSPRNSCATGNNEFSAMTSLYSIYNTCTSNVYKNNKYYESIFGLFNDAGYSTTSFHDFVEWYYKRSVIHPNMGSGKYYGARDLGIKTSSDYGEWPNDEEFIEKVMDILLNNEDGKPFMTFLTTVTSHQPYSNSSTYGDLYMKDFKSKGYSTTTSRYLSKIKVVDNALGRLLERLQSAEKLEDTVIVMLADHYPYGLNKTYVKEMITHDLTDYDIEKTPFVIYNPSIESMEKEDYTSYMNVVPTIANLMGFNYDPRLYMGQDLLSNEYESRVVFADGSWKNEKAYYNASTSKIKYYGESTYSEEEIKTINNKIHMQIEMSTRAIKTNYFNYLGNEYTKYKEKEEAKALEEMNTILPTDGVNEELTQ